MSYIKKNKNSKWYFLVSFLMIFVATAFIFSSSVFSSSEMDMKIEYGGDIWDVSGESPEWTSKGDNVKFKVDLSEYYKELLKEDEEGSATEYNRPFNIESHDQNPTFTKGKDESGNFNGVYHVAVDNLSDDGELEINVVFTEDNGWEIPSSENVEFSILKDTISPKITYNGMDDGEVTHKRNVNLKVDIEEENLTTKNITITRNGEKIDPQIDWNSNTASINFEEDGKYIVTTDAEDKAGNASKETLTFYVHKSDPEWQITSGDNGVEDGAVLNNSTVTLGVQNGIDIGSATVEVKKGNERVDEVELAVDGQSATAEYKFKEDGEYTLEATLQDAHGEEEHNLETFTLTVDQTAPLVSINDDEGTLVNESTYKEPFNLLINVEDPNFNENESSVTITHVSFDEEKHVEEVDLSNGNGSFRVKEAGEYIISGTLIDQAGNKTSIDDKSFTLYSNSDLVTIKANNGSLQEYYTNNVEVNVNYWNFRPGGNSFKVTKYNLLEGIEEPYLDSDDLNGFGLLFWLTHNFKEGQYNLTIETHNIAGKIEHVNRAFIVDKTDPKVILDAAPLNEDEHVTSTFVNEQGGISELFDISASDDYLHEKSVEVQYQDAEGNQQSWINADAGKWVEDEFTLKEELFDSEGQYTINVHATDEAGRSTTKEHSFTIDDTAPVIELTEVDRYSNKMVDQEVVVTENNYEHNNVTIEIKKQNEDGEFEDIRDNFDEWENGGITSDALFRFKEDGTYKMSVEASDAAGNKAKNVSTTFTIDTNHPNTVISGVEDQGHYNETMPVDMQVKDRNIDESNTNLEVNKWNKETNQFEAMDIDTSLIFENKQANWQYDFDEEGKYELILNATDKAGHQAESQHIIFTIDKTNPEVLIDSLTNGKFYATEQQVNFQVNELNYPENNVHFTVVKDGQDITEDVEGNANWRNESTASTFTYTFDQDGDYEVTLSSEDKAGNKSKVMNRNFTIDLTNPTIHVDGVEDTIHYDDEREVKIDIADTNITSYDLLITNDKDEDFKIEESGNDNFQEEFTFAEEGDYVIDISTIDDAGNQSSKLVEFTIDKTDPVISIDSQMPTFTTFENIGEKGINNLVPILLTEENIKDKAVTIQVTDNQGNTKTYNEEETGEWEPTDEEQYQYVLTEDFFEADGDYTITVKAGDKAGRKEQTSLSFTVDNTKPVIDLTDIATFNKEEKTATVKITEHNYGNNDVTIGVYREKRSGGYEDITKEFSKWKNTQEVASLAFPFTTDGKYRIVANATDAAGNKAVTQQDTFTIDTVNPDISISGVTDKTHYNNSQQVTVSVDDDNVSKADTNLSIFKLNQSTGKMQPYKTGKAPNFSRRAMDWQYTFSTSDEGTYRVQIGATDLAGNKGNSQSVDFTIDKTAPVLSINDITDGEYYNSGQNAEFTVRETNHASNSVQFAVTKDGQDMTSLVEGSRGSAWRTAGPLSRLSYGFMQDGAYTVTLNATDEAGNRSKTAQKSFVIDTVDPSIDISGVEDGEHYNEDVPVGVTIKDVNFDSNTIRVTRNGANYPVGGFSITNNGYQNSIASFSHQFTQEGDYEIFVESTDKANNNQTESIAFTIDKTAPVITPLMGGDNEELVDGSYINHMFQPIFQLDNEEDTIVSVHLNGGSNIVGNVPAASKEMEYNYEVLARDEAGNETTLNVGFILDTTRPELNISGIIEGFFNNNIRPHVDYSDKHLDEERTSVTLNGAPFENGIELTEEQDYTLEAVITDLADNVSERTIVFTIDKTAPKILFKEAISGKYLNEVLIPELLIEDMTGYDIIALTLNGEPYELGDPIETEGKHVLYFEVKDQAGNIQQLTAEFIIDLTPPVVLFEGVEEDKEYVEAVDLAISLENAEDRMKQVTVNGEIYEDFNIENNGFTLHFKDIDEYKVEVTADDQAGNEVTESLTFAITEKGLLTQFYENKPLFSFSIAGVLGVLLAIFIAALRSRKKSVEE